MIVVHRIQVATTCSRGICTRRYTIGEGRARRHFLQRYGFQHGGRIVSRTTVHDIDGNVDYAAGVIAWTAGGAVGRDHIYLKRLISGSTATLTLLYPDGPFSVHISGSMLVITTFDENVYVWESPKNIKAVQDTAPHKCKACSSLQTIYAASLSGNVVALLHEPHDAIEGTEVTLVSWSLDSREVHRFPVDVQRSSLLDATSLNLVVTNDRKALVLFERVFGSPNWIHQTRYTLDGTVESRVSAMQPDIEGYTRHYENGTQPANQNGHDQEVLLWTYVQRNEEQNGNPSSHNWKILSITYNPRSDKIYINENLITNPTPSVPRPSDFLWHKDIAYIRTASTPPSQLQVLNLSQSTVKNAEISLQVITFPNIQNVMLVQGPSTLLGDETFLIEACRTHYTIRCFDKNIELPNKNTLYRSLVHWHRMPR